MDPGDLAGDLDLGDLADALLVILAEYGQRSLSLQHKELTMRTTDPEAALHFIGAARLPEPRSRSRGSPDSKTVLDALETTRQQAAVVGAG